MRDLSELKSAIRMFNDATEITEIGSPSAAHALLCEVAKLFGTEEKPEPALVAKKHSRVRYEHDDFRYSLGVPRTNQPEYASDHFLSLSEDLKMLESLKVYFVGPDKTSFVLEVSDHYGIIHSMYFKAGDEIGVDYAAAIANCHTPEELAGALQTLLKDKTGKAWVLVENFNTTSPASSSFSWASASTPLAFLAGKFFKEGHLSNRDEIAPDFTQADFQKIIADGFEKLTWEKGKIDVSTQLGVIQGTDALLVRIETDKTKTFAFGFAVSLVEPCEPEEMSKEDEYLVKCVKYGMPDSGDRSRNEPLYLMSAKASRSLIESSPFDSNTLAIIKRLAVANGWVDVQMHGQQFLFIAKL